MKTSSIGRQLIEEFEGLILGAYDDANDRVVRPGDSVRGTLTIGYGHTTSAGPPRVTIGQKITKEQADQYLAADLAKVEEDVNNLVKVPLNQNQFDALVSFHYNTGGLGRSSLLGQLNQKNYEGAAEQFGNWIRGNGQVLQGLVRRRQAEKELFMKPYIEAPIGAPVIVATIGGVVAAQNTNWNIWYVVLGAAGIAALISLIIYLYRKYHVAKT